MNIIYNAMFLFKYWNETELFINDVFEFLVSQTLSLA